MPTSRINLSNDVYQRINTGYGKLILESLTGDIHVALTDNQPVASNAAFHKLTDRHRLVFDELDTNVWVIGKNTGAQAVVTEFDHRMDALGNNDLIIDAWGRQKTITDYSLFHGICTFDVPNQVWEEQTVATNGDWTPLSVTGTNVSSVGGALECRSGTTLNAGGAVRSKRNPRYQPNRGHLYSTAVICPSPNADGIRRWGVFDGDNGVYFELEGDGASHVLYAVRKSNGTVKTRQAVSLPTGFDVSKGHVYDIQYQWRGLGNYKWFADLQEVYADEILGTLTELSVQNPALPASYESITHTTTEIKIQAGCVDITSEGGLSEGRQFATVSTGTTFYSAANTGSAIIALRLPRTVTYNAATVNNTRDIVLSKLTSWCRDEAATRVWFGRDTTATNLAALTWTDLNGGNVEYLLGGAGSALDTAFQADKASMQLVLTEWVDIEDKNIIINPSEDAAPFYGTPGDIIVIEIQSIAGTDDCVATLYLSEEV